MGRGERPPHYRGDLRQTALPEMLAIIHQTRVAGVIEAVCGEFIKQVLLESGYVVHASSSDLADSSAASCAASAGSATASSRPRCRSAPTGEPARSARS